MQNNNYHWPEDDLTIEQREQIYVTQKTMQYEMAENLIKEICLFVPDFEEKLTPMLLLDALGCAGLSLTIGTDASRTFIELVAEQANN